MMKKNVLLILFLLLSSVFTFGQETITSFEDDFEDSIIWSGWDTDARSHSLTEENGMLTINVDKPTEDEKWDGLTMGFGENTLLDLSNNGGSFSVKLKADKDCKVDIAVWDTTGMYNPGNNQIDLVSGADWATMEYAFEGDGLMRLKWNGDTLGVVDPAIIDHLLLTFNGGSPWSGTVMMDDLKIGGSDYEGKEIKAVKAIGTPAVNGSTSGEHIWDHAYKGNFFWNTGADEVEGLSAYFKTLFSPDTLYVFVSVADPEVVDNDEVGICVDLGTDRSIDIGWEGNPTDEDGFLFSKITVGEGSKTARGVVYAVETTGDGYNVEMGIAWANITTDQSLIDNAMSSGEFWMDLGIKNNGEGAQVLQWSGDDNSYWNSSAKSGSITLLEPEVLTEYLENFNEPVDMDFWAPYQSKVTDSDRKVFEVSQENDALKVDMQQNKFHNGQMYLFLKSGKIFDMTDNPYASIRIKLEPGAQWGSVANGFNDVEAVNFSLSPFEIDSLGEQQRALQDQHNILDDGEWKTYYFDFSEPNYALNNKGEPKYTNNLSEIAAFLFETPNWPDAVKATYWFDDFTVGIEAFPSKSLDIVESPSKLAIDGNKDWIYQFGVPNKIEKLNEGEEMTLGLSASFVTQYDNDSLYCLVEITDPQVSTDDELGFLIDIGGEKTDYSTLGNGWKLGDKDENGFIFSKYNYGGGLSFRGANYDTLLTDNGFNVEFSIAWNDISTDEQLINDFKERGTFLFDVGYKNVDDGVVIGFSQDDNSYWKSSMKSAIATLKPIETVTEYAQDFEGDVDMRVWEPNDKMYGERLVFENEVEQGALQIDFAQEKPFDGQMFDFAPYAFDLSEYPYATMTIKVDSSKHGPAGSQEPEDVMPFNLSIWSPDKVRQCTDGVEIPIDGEWHKVRFDWSDTTYNWKGEAYPQQINNVVMFLLEHGTFPDPRSGHYQIDDLKIGSAAAAPPALESMEVTGNNTMLVDTTIQLSVEFSPADVLRIDKRVTWNSDNEEVASVDDEGVVTSFAPGTANITAESVNSGKAASFEVTVKEEIVCVNAINVTTENTTISTNELPATVTIEAEVDAPEEAESGVSWRVSPEDLASIDQNGELTINDYGTVTITATSKDGCEIEGALELTIETVGISEMKEAGFNFYPNPVSEILHIAKNDQIEVLIVANIFGQKVKEIYHPKSTLSVGDLNSGLYLLDIRTIDGKRRTGKIMVR